MPILHILLIKVKDEVTKDLPVFIEEAKNAYSKVESVKSVRVGESINAASENKGYNFSLLLEFEDEAVSNIQPHCLCYVCLSFIQALKKYQEHPLTQAKKAEHLDPFAAGE